MTTINTSSRNLTIRLVHNNEEVLDIIGPCDGLTKSIRVIFESENKAGILAEIQRLNLKFDREKFKKFLEND